MILDLSDAKLPVKGIDRLPLILSNRGVWIDNYGDTQIVNFMPLKYVHNLRKFLLLRAEYIHDRYIIRYYITGVRPYGDMAMDAFESEAAQVMDENPKTWIKHTPLYRRLVLREWRLRRK